MSKIFRKELEYHENPLKKHSKNLRDVKYAKYKKSKMSTQNIRTSHHIIFKPFLSDFIRKTIIEI